MLKQLPLHRHALTQTDIPSHAVLPLFPPSYDRLSTRLCLEKCIPVDGDGGALFMRVCADKQL